MRCSDAFFADWALGSAQRNANAHRRLDAIEAQLARLERTVSMEVLPARAAADDEPRLADVRPAIGFTVLQT